MEKEFPELGVLLVSLIAHVTARLLYYKLVISFWANIKLNSALDTAFSHLLSSC